MKAKIVLLISIVLGYSQQANSQQLVDDLKKIIIIDPGHGGVDSGAISEDGIQEKDVVLDIARSMLSWNKGLLKSKFDIYLTRNLDTLISLRDRAKLTKYLNPDVFISLHCNHIDDSKVKGIGAYVYNDHIQSILYARSIMSELNQKLGFKTREVKQANFQVLRETIDSSSGVLLELGYLSNQDESGYLKNSKKRKALALAILMAI